MPRLLLTLLFPLLAGCSSPGAQVAAEARQALVGMRADDLQACAGIPTRTRHLSDGTELLSYEQRNANVGGLHLNLPSLGEFSIGNSGSYCHALFRVAEGRVIGLNYTGDNDDVFGREGVCAPIVRGCLRSPVPVHVPPPAVPPADPVAGQAGPDAAEAALSPPR
ncbi:MAG TPA: hypothetical protein VNZ61_08310 [Roseomonas sp.]|nr:hypothetical protein [Roseomonas sp.]